MRYRLKERPLTLTDNFGVKDETGQEIYEAKGDFLRIGDTFSLYEKATGEEIIQIKQRIFSYTTQYDIFSRGSEVGSLHIRKEEQDKHVEVASSDGTVLYIRGNYKDWDLNIVDHYGRLFAHISREFAIMGDTYTVDVADGVDGPFILAIAIILDELREDRKI